MSNWRSVAALIIMSLVLSAGDITVNYRVTTELPGDQFEFSTDGSVVSGSSLAVPECEMGTCRLQVGVEAGDVSLTRGMELATTDGTNNQILELPSHETGSCDVVVGNEAVDDDLLLALFDDMNCYSFSKQELLYEFILEHEPRD
ncbi:MAG: hypothetical protein QF415_16720, partial [Candidatus Undinarchaeales archaeon]|nr:hypothetical protein [Candidatus Undinarchaeales archaeon]